MKDQIIITLDRAKVEQNVQREREMERLHKDKADRYQAVLDNWSLFAELGTTKSVPEPAREKGSEVGDVSGKRQTKEQLDMLDEKVISAFREISRAAKRSEVVPILREYGVIAADLDDDRAGKRFIQSIDRLKKKDRVHDYDGNTGKSNWAYVLPEWKGQDGKLMKQYEPEQANNA